jgi:hypothetical protein
MANWMTQFFKFVRDLPGRASPMWPWPLRRVRKANIPDTERDYFERYGENVIAMMVSSGFTGNVANARDWLTERADARERRERWISGRDLFLEIVIIALIGWEIHEGRQQAKVLEHMDSTSGDTASAMKTARDSLKSLADAQNEALKILQQEQAERAKKPRFTIYVGNVPIDKANARLVPLAGNAQDMASLDLVLKNEGDVLANPSQIHILVPEDTNFDLSPIPPVPESEEPPKPATRTMSYAVPLMPVDKTIRIHARIWAPKGRAAFSAAFTITTPQLQAVTPLGSLTVLPPKH